MTFATTQNPFTKRDSLLLTIAALVLALALAVWQALSPKLATMAFLALILLILAMMKMELAVVLYTLSAFLVIGPIFAVTGRFGHSEGLYTSELMLGLLALVWGARLVSRAVHRKRIPLDTNPIDLPLVGLIGTALFAFVAAQFTWDYRVGTEHRYLIRQVTEIGLLCMPVAVYLLVSDTVRDLRWIKAVYWSVLAVGVVSFFVICPWIELPAFVKTFWTGLLPVPLVSFLYAHIVLQQEFNVTSMAAVVALAGLLIVQFMFMSWVVMWFSTSISLCVISWYRSKKLFTAIVCASLLIVAFRPDMWLNIYETESTSRSLERFDLWRSVLDLASKRPFWGIGPGNFYPYYSHEYAAVYGTINVPSPHSNYVQIIIEYGFIGGAFFIWFIVVCLLRLRNSFLQTKDEWEKVFFLGMTGYFAGMAAAAFLADYLISASSNNGLVSFSTTVYTWILLGLAMSVRRNMLERQSSEPSSDAPKKLVLSEAGSPAHFQPNRGHSPTKVPLAQNRSERDA